MKRGKPMRRTPLRGFSTRRRPTLAAALWRDARDAALDRDGHTCQAAARGLVTACDTFPLEVHHLLPRGRGGTHDLDNLLSLCGTHHRWAHANPRSAYRLDLLRRTPAQPEVRRIA